MHLEQRGYYKLQISTPIMFICKDYEKHKHVYSITKSKMKGT